MDRRMRPPSRLSQHDIGARGACCTGPSQPTRADFQRGEKVLVIGSDGALRQVRTRLAPLNASPSSDVGWTDTRSGPPPRHLE